MPRESHGRPDAVVLLDRHGRVEFANEAFGGLIDVPLGAVKGRGLSELLPDAVDLLRVDLPENRTLVLIRDVAPDRRARDDARRVQDVREQERTQIAREVHDELGQVLIGLKMQLATWIDETGGAARGAGVLDAMDRAIREVRRITTQLRPLVLDDLGLKAAIEWQKTDFQERTGIRCSFTGSLDLEVSPGPATAIFRILQEALTNVARHAAATQVAIVLKREDAAVVLTVRDNGRGIGPDAAGGAGGFGLQGMRERAAAWGGTVSVAGVAGKGTMITVRVPLEEAAA